MSKVESAVTWAIGIAADNSHGYSQQNRWGNPDYDCSSFVISAYEQAGVPVKSKGATYTGNMRSVFKRCGFVEVPLSNLQRGDVLLNERDHTALYIGGSQIVHARSSEGNSIPGDGSGNEIRVQSYYNGNWDCVLRYVDNGSSTAASTAASTNQTNNQTTLQNSQTISENSLTEGDEVILPTLSKGSKGASVKALQTLLVGYGYSVGSWGCDGDFGNGTLIAVLNFQSDNALDKDGVVGGKTWSKLING